MLTFLSVGTRKQTFGMGREVQRGVQTVEGILIYTPDLGKAQRRRNIVSNYLYISVCSSTLSGVLVREDRDEQKPIFYVSKTLDGAETRYPILEKLAFAIVISARKLRPYYPVVENNSA